MAAVPFGFSVGDFVASIQLIHKAAKALRSTSGATEQYQQALLDLELIETVLRRVQGLSPASASHETIQAIQLCALACHTPLAHFLQKVRELEPHLNFSGKSSPADFLHIKKGGHKLRWAILLEQDVAKLKASIGPGIEIINTLLQIESLERGAITQQSLDRITEQVGRVLPAVDKVATFLQSNITTVNHMQNLPTLAHLKNELARNATSQQMQTLASAIADLSVRLNNTATKDQANGLAKLVEDNKTQQSSGVAALSSLAAHNIQELTELKRITESSNRMLATLLHQIPPVSGSVAHGSPGMATLDDSNRLQGSSGIRFSRPTSPVAVWQALLKALRRALDGLLLFFLWLAPAFQLYLRTLNTMSRSPKMLLDSNITFVDVLNREFSLQYQQFRYWPVMSAFLQCQFRGCPGALRITHKRFAVFKEMRSTGRGAMIPFEEWEYIVRPGQRVLMSMYIGHDDSTQGQWRARNVCPSCGFDEPQPHTCDDSIWKKCADCGQFFLRLDLQQVDSAQDRGAYPDTLDDRDIFDCKEISKFSRVHDLRQIGATPESPARLAKLYAHEKQHGRPRSDAFSSHEDIPILQPRPVPIIHQGKNFMPKEQTSSAIMKHSLYR